MNKIPDTIYLQLFGDGEPSEDVRDIDIGNVTWSEDRIYLSDVEYYRKKSLWIASRDEKPETLSLLANCSCDCFVLVRVKDYLYGTTGHYNLSENCWLALMPHGKDGYKEVKSDVEYWMPIPELPKGGER